MQKKESRIKYEKKADLLIYLIILNETQSWYASGLTDEHEQNTELESK